MVISVDGIIGAGKSTLLRHLKRRGYPVYQEPFEANRFLPLFYADMHRWAYSAQVEFFRLRRDLWWHMITSGAPVIFTERSCMADRWTFGEMLARDGYMTPEEYAAYCHWFETFSRWEGLKPDLAVILDENPLTALLRIKKRGRPMEAGITLEYLKSLREAHFEHKAELGKRVLTLPPELAATTKARADLILKGVQNA